MSRTTYPSTPTAPLLFGLQRTPKIAHEQPKVERSLDPVVIQEALSQRVIHQTEAVARVARRLAAHAAGLCARPDRPLSFFFAGPTGVGKTELASAIASEWHGNAADCIRLDMSEYTQGWATASLIGPKPGYVGYDAPDGWLTTRVARRPESVVIFDEIEKADKSVHNLLLQVLDAGQLTESSGSTVDFSRTVIVFTSNCGADDAYRPSIGFGRGSADSSAVTQALRKVFAPEFLGRLGDVVVFEALSSAAFVDIAARSIDAMIQRQQCVYGRELLVEPAVVAQVAVAGSVFGGARAVHRAVEALFEAALPLVADGATALTATVCDGGSPVWRRTSSASRFCHAQARPDSCLV